MLRTSPRQGRSLVGTADSGQHLSESAEGWLARRPAYRPLNSGTYPRQHAMLEPPSWSIVPGQAASQTQFAVAAPDVSGWWPLTTGDVRRIRCGQEAEWPSPGRRAESWSAPLIGRPLQLGLNGLKVMQDAPEFSGPRRRDWWSGSRAASRGSRLAALNPVQLTQVARLRNRRWVRLCRCRKNTLSSA